MTSILEISDFHGPYAGTFIPTLVAVGDAVRTRLGLEYRCAFPVEVRDRPWNALLADAGIEVTFLDKAAPLPQRLRAVHALARGTEAALIRSHFTGWDMESAVAGRAAGAAVVWNVHTGDLTYDWRGRARDLIKVRMVSRFACDRVIAVSDQIATDLRRRGFPARKVATVLNGIDVERLARESDGADARAARAAFGLPPEGRVVLLFGRTPYLKGVDVVVRALSEPAPPPGLNVLIVGGEELRASLPDLLPEWLRVVAPVPDAAPLYAASDVFVSASRGEGFSYAIGEAMAAGLPVVSSDIPGPAAYFAAPGVRRYPAEDAAALRRELIAALDDRDDAVGAGNRAYVAERLGLDRHVDGVVDVLTRSLAARPLSRR